MPVIYDDQRIFFDGLEISGETNAIGLEYVAETEDNSTFGIGTRSNVGGLTTATAAVEGFLDPEKADPVLFDAVGMDGKVLSFGLDGDDGSLAYTLNALLGEYSPEGEHGRLLKFSASAVSRSRPVRGTVMANATGLAATGNGTARQLGQVAVGQKLFAAIHLLAVDDPADSITVSIESDADSGFASPTVRTTFAAANVIGGQWAVPVPGEIADPWWRVAYSISGATPAFSLVAILGIH
jgi:hypothetical protein